MVYVAPCCVCTVPALVTGLSCTMEKCCVYVANDSVRVPLSECSR